jgi:cytochrome c5
MRTPTKILALLLSALLLTACGKQAQATTEQKADAPQAQATQTTASQPAAPAATAAATQTSAGGDDQAGAGAKVFKSTCFMCHQTGAAGAPIFGNKADWAPRIAKGKDTLYKHALGGFTGDKGTMPAKGGNASLIDEEVKAAVDYMVGKAS